VVIVLGEDGLVSVEKLRDARPYVIVGAFIIAAVVTPPTCCRSSARHTMCLLYEAGLLLARFIRTGEKTKRISQQREKSDARFFSHGCARCCGQCVCALLTERSSSRCRSTPRWAASRSRTCASANETYGKLNARATNARFIPPFLYFW